MITSEEELRNIILLGLELWVGTPDTYGTRPWKMTKPQLTEGPRGTKLGSAIITAEYLYRWGITDPNNHHTVHMFARSSRLFNTEYEAMSYIRKRT